MGLLRTFRLGNIVLTPRYVSRIYKSLVIQTGQYDFEQMLNAILIDRYLDEFQNAVRFKSIARKFKSFNSSNELTPAQLTQQFALFDSEYLPLLLDFILFKANGDLSIVTLSILLTETPFLENDNATISEWLKEICSELRQNGVPLNLIYSEYTIHYNGTTF